MWRRCGTRADRPIPIRSAPPFWRESAGADGITAHLREDRRHIRDGDIEALVGGIGLPLNFECAATAEMQAIALRHRPHAVCLVPEKREERTTEGGLDVALRTKAASPISSPRCATQGCRVSMFIGHDPRQIEASARDRGGRGRTAHRHLLRPARRRPPARARCANSRRLRKGAALAQALGLEVHAGHGLTFDTVGPVAAIPQVMELNIGHFLIGESIFLGLGPAIAEMRRLMDEARNG